jgi:hypothetical protein
MNFLTTDVRVWISTALAGLIVAGIGVYFAVRVDHALTQVDLLLILGGAGLLAGKSLFDLGVQVPTPPKV